VAADGSGVRKNLGLFLAPRRAPSRRSLAASFSFISSIAPCLRRIFSPRRVAREESLDAALARNGGVYFPCRRGPQAGGFDLRPCPLPLALTSARRETGILVGRRRRPSARPSGSTRAPAEARLLPGGSPRAACLQVRPRVSAQKARVSTFGRTRPSSAVLTVLLARPSSPVDG